MLTLSDIERGTTDRIIAARALKFDRFVERNLPLLTKFGVADATGDKKDMAGLLVRAALKLRGVLLDRPLRNQLFDSLGPENKAALRELLIEYDDAIELGPTKDELNAGAMADRKVAPTGRARFGRLTAERIESVGREIKLAFDRAMYSGGLLYAYAMQGIDVSPADEAKLRQYCQEFAERTKDSPKEADNQKLFLQFCSVLTVEQQVQAIRKFQGRGKPAPTGKSSERTKPANQAK